MATPKQGFFYFNAQHVFARSESLRMRFKVIYSRFQLVFKQTLTDRATYFEVTSLGEARAPTRAPPGLQSGAAPLPGTQHHLRAKQTNKNSLPQLLVQLIFIRESRTGCRGHVSPLSLSLFFRLLPIRTPKVSPSSSG